MPPLPEKGRHKYNATLRLSKVARYQLELTSRSLELSHELLLLSGTEASMPGLHVVPSNPKRMNSTAFSMGRCLWKCRQRRWKNGGLMNHNKLCRELHTPVKKISYHRSFLPGYLM